MEGRIHHVLELENGKHSHLLEYCTPLVAACHLTLFAPVRLSGFPKNSLGPTLTSQYVQGGKPVHQHEHDSLTAIPLFFGES